MITLNEFIAKYNGQQVEVVDPNALDQCVDLVIRYVIDVLGMPITTFAGIQKASDIWLNRTPYLEQNFDFIVNTNYSQPVAGDIIVWGTPPGHTAIATGNNPDVNTFECVSQNNPLTQRTTIAMFKYINSWGNVLGWLRKIGSNLPTVSQSALQDCQINLKNASKDKLDLEKQLTTANQKIADIISECQKEKQAYKDKVIKLVQDTAI